MVPKKKKKKKIEQGKGVILTKSSRKRLIDSVDILENRFKILPMGVVSKKLIGALITREKGVN